MTITFYYCAYLLHERASSILGSLLQNLRSGHVFDLLRRVRQSRDAVTIVGITGVTIESSEVSITGTHSPFDVDAGVDSGIATSGYDKLLFCKLIDRDFRAILRLKLRILTCDVGDASTNVVVWAEGIADGWVGAHWVQTGLVVGVSVGVALVASPGCEGS